MNKQWQLMNKKYGQYGGIWYESSHSLDPLKPKSRINITL